MKNLLLSERDVMQMLAEAFAEPVEQISKQRRRDEIAGWDSMGALMLMAELDDRCGLQLSAEQSRELHSVEDILQYLHRNQRLSEAP